MIAGVRHLASVPERQHADDELELELLEPQAAIPRAAATRAAAALMRRVLTVISLVT